MPIDPVKNYQNSLKQVGYVTRKEATQATYDRIGFMSGLEVHQQLLTREKLFCRCPAGKYHKDDEYDAELIRHMRPTLSELGEYDGTALMEFKTKKEIIYRINNQTACTYEVDDTPPFKIDKEALEIAIEISLLSKLNIVGEVHVTRKQYLDGSIPTGFQRTAIIGVEGVIPLRNKSIRLIQLSLEEDSCREISDVGHLRVYKTDRLGMPLIETVTYPDMVNPDEVKEACDYIRFLNRSTGKVRTGIGSGRQDVNVSCKGGTRVEIKGVAHTKWIPELTHNECFRQWALLLIKSELTNRIPEYNDWKIRHEKLDFDAFPLLNFEPIKIAKDAGHILMAVNLPGFRGIMSHFTQPGKCFADEISDRLKVIACIEKPNMTHTEEFEPILSGADFEIIAPIVGAKEGDAQIVFWAPKEDVETALETIQERCFMAFEGVPNETRKSFENGTTIFERVLPGADRMYPDTDTAPIPLAAEYIENLRKNLPDEISDFHKMLNKWGAAEDTYAYILRKNLFPLIKRIVDDLGYNPKFIANFFGHTYKAVEGRSKKSPEFNKSIFFAMFAFLKQKNIHPELSKNMVAVIFEHPKMDFDSVLTTIGYKKMTKDMILSKIPFLKNKFHEIRYSENPANEKHWIMGQLRKNAMGNISLKELFEKI